MTPESCVTVVVTYLPPTYLSTYLVGTYLPNKYPTYLTYTHETSIEM